VRDPRLIDSRIRRQVKRVSKRRETKEEKLLKENKQANSQMAANLSKVKSI
jgi:hypothetical protein